MRRAENGDDRQPHPCFCVTTVGLWHEINGDWSGGYKWKLPDGRRVSDVGGNLLRALEVTQTPWVDVLRSNRGRLDPAPVCRIRRRHLPSRRRLSSRRHDPGLDAQAAVRLPLARAAQHGAPAERDQAAGVAAHDRLPQMRECERSSRKSSVAIQTGWLASASFGPMPRGSGKRHATLKKLFREAARRPLQTMSDLGLSLAQRGGVLRSADGARQAHPSSKGVVVLGMHRSGTSLVTRLVSLPASRSATRMTCSSAARTIRAAIGSRFAAGVQRPAARGARRDVVLPAGA